MKTKICTSIEQSERLVKLGLDKSTADMHYFSDGYNLTRLDIGYDKDNAKFYRGTKNKYIPAWSLTALLELMPNNFIELTKDGGMYRIKAEQKYYSCLVENPIDAAFEMIVYLIEKGCIKPNNSNFS